MGNVNDTRPSTEEAQTRVLYAAGRFLERDETFSAADAMMYERGEQLLPGEEPAFADPRDVTYILDRPTSRAFRVAYGTRWVHCYLPDTDFIFYLDDDSFLNVPRLFHLLDGVQIAEDRHLQERKVDRNEKKLQLRYRNERNKVESLVLGYMMETDTDMGRYDICEMCDPCDKCLHDRQLKEFCGQEKLQHLSLGGCLAYMNTCKIYGDEKPLADCIYDAQFESSRIADYFGTKKSPLWLLGMGWLFGKRVINYIARNAADLKKRGAADLILGYWLTGIEDLNWVDTGPLGNFRFHDYPMRGNTFTRECHDETILVHRMTPKRWAQDFDAETCVLDCALERDPEVVGEGPAEDSENPFGDETVRELERNPTGLAAEAGIDRGMIGADEDREAETMDLDSIDTAPSPPVNISADQASHLSREYLVHQGATVLVLNPPARDFQFGIDNHLWATGPKFMGVKFIPPGVHFLYYSASSEGPTGDMVERCGFFANLRPKEVLVRRFCAKTETLVKLGNADEEMRYVDGVRHWDFDLNLGEYPMQDGLYEDWREITRHISAGVIAKIEPVGGVVGTRQGKDVTATEIEEAERNCGINASSSSSSKSSCPEEINRAAKIEPWRAPEYTRKSADTAGAEAASFGRLFFSTIPAATVRGEELSGAEITKRHLDKSHVVKKLVEHEYKDCRIIPVQQIQKNSKFAAAEAAAAAAERDPDVDENDDDAASSTASGSAATPVTPSAAPRVPRSEQLKTEKAKHRNLLCYMALLGEIEFAFVTFLLAQNYDAFEQWKKLLSLLCSCGELVLEEPVLSSEGVLGDLQLVAWLVLCRDWGVCGGRVWSCIRLVFSSQWGGGIWPELVWLACCTTKEEVGEDAWRDNFLVQNAIKLVERVEDAAEEWSPSKPTLAAIAQEKQIFEALRTRARHIRDLLTEKIGRKCEEVAAGATSDVGGRASPASCEGAGGAGKAEQTPDILVDLASIFHLLSRKHTKQFPLGDVLNPVVRQVATQNTWEAKCSERNHALVDMDRKQGLEDVQRKLAHWYREDALTKVLRIGLFQTNKCLLVGDDRGLYFTDYYQALRRGAWQAFHEHSLRRRGLLPPEGAGGKNM
eukprot:g7757.t1